MQTKLHLSRLQHVDANGDPIVGSLGFYQTGTSTPITTYSDYDRNTANANPLNADSSGRFGPVFFDPADLRTGVKVVLYPQADGAGTPVYTDDRYQEDVLEWTDISSLITQARIADLINPRTAAEIAAGVGAYAPGNSAPDIVDPNYPELDVRRYGGVGDGATDDSLALQMVINVALHGKYGSAELPDGDWLHNSSLYYQYDAANNSTAPSGSNRSGTFSWRGTGANDYANEVNSVYKGSRLVYNGSTGDGHIIDGTNFLPGGIRAVRFYDLTIRCNTTGKAASWTYCSRMGVGAERCLVYQENASGDGLYFEDCFLIEVHDNYVAHPTDAIASDTTIGFQAVNPNQAAGMYSLGGNTFRGFGVGRVFGNHTATTATGSEGMACVNEPVSNQSLKCATGAHYGYGVRAGTIVSPYTENCVTAGIAVTRTANQLTFITPFFTCPAATQADFVLGDSTNAFTKGHGGITIINPKHTDTLTAAYERHVSNQVGAVEIINPSLSGPTGTPIPFKLNDETQRGLSIIRPDISSGWTTLVVSDDGTTTDLRHRCELYIEDQTEGVELRNGAPNTGTETLAAAPSSGNADLLVATTLLDSSGGAFSLTLPDGTAEGQEKTFLMTTVPSGNVTLTITSAHPSITSPVTFNAVDDMLIVRWTNGEWALVNSHNV